MSSILKIGTGLTKTQRRSPSFCWPTTGTFSLSFARQSLPSSSQEVKVNLPNDQVFAIFKGSASEVRSNRSAFFALTVGYVTPVYEIHTIPLDAYHSNKWFKVTLEVLFIGGLLYLFVAEVREIRGRRARRKAVALWTGKQVDMTWAQATWEHYTGEDALGNFVDVGFMAVGFTLCLFWGVVVGEIEVLANTLSELHRPDSVVTYDDTDHDEWSEYHHEIGHIEELAEHAMDVMVISFMHTEKLLIGFV